MRRRLGIALVAAGLATGAGGSAPAAAAQPCTIDVAGETIACQFLLAGAAVDCGIRRVERPPFVTRTAGCGVGAVGAGCADTSYPSTVGPPDGRDCVVLLGPLTCRVHLNEAGRPEGAPGCTRAGRAGARRASRARARRR